MELLVHASTSGHLLVVCTLKVATIQIGYVHVIITTLIPRLLLWVMTIFVRVSLRAVMQMSSIQMLHSGMGRFVRVVVHAVGSTIHHGSPRT